MLAFLSGKKAYIMAALIAVGAGTEYLGTEVPTEVWALTVAGAVAAIRSAISKLA